MIPWIVNMVQTNEMAQAAMVMAPMATLTWAARSVPMSLFKAAERAVTFTLTFRSDTEEYYFVSKYVSEHIVSKKWSRKFTYDTKVMWDDETEQQIEMVSGVTLGYGNHLGRFNGVPVIANRALEKSDNSSQFKEILTLRFFGRSSAPVEAFSDEIQAQMKSMVVSNNVPVRINSGGSWKKAPALVKRSLDSVFIPEAQELSEKMLRFSDRKEEYRRKGIPYRLGILLEGPPGTGKTSLIHALASATGREIVFLNLSALRDDSELMDLMSYNMRWDKVLLVVEDIDVSRVATDREKESETVSLSTLLNMFDGLLTPEGMITIATTNHIDQLDPALTRSGRFDHVVSVGKLKWGSFIKMVRLLRDDYEENKLFWNCTCIDYVPTEGAICREWLLNEDLDFFKKKFLS